MPTDDYPLTEDELKAIREVTSGLQQKLEGEELDMKAVVACTLIYKCRVDRAIESYIDWLSTRKEFGFTSIFPDGWDKPGSDFTKHWDAYEVCGRDNEGRQVFWITNKSPILVENEAAVMRSSCVFFLAMFGDLHSLRNGITMVIDQSANVKKVGNERKMQKVWMNFPNRPQAIFITGAGFVKRIFINGLLKFASLFSKQKIIDRVRFVEMDTIRAAIPSQNMPTQHGGDEHPPMEQWVRQRLEQFPLPPT